MTKKRKLGQSGASKGATTGSRQDTQSTGVELTLTRESPPTSDMSASTRQKSRSSQRTPNSLGGDPNLMHAKALGAFAAKLGALVEWRHLRLADGRVGYVLFFDEKKWQVHPTTKELTPLGALGEK